MPSSNYTVDRFLGGEWSALAQGRQDQPSYRTAMQVCYNGLPIEEGAWGRRPGFVEIGYTHRGLPGVVHSFEEASVETHELALLELTNNQSNSFLRVWLDNGFLYPKLLTEAPVVITSFSGATPSVMTVTPAQTWVDGDTILIDIDASTPSTNAPNLAGRQFVLKKLTTTTFNIGDTITSDLAPAYLDGATISYTNSTGTAAKIKVLSAPYTTLDEVRAMRMYQSGDKVIFLSRTVTPWVFTLTSALVATLADADFKEADGPYLDPLPGTSQTLNKTASATTSDGITYHVTIGSDGPSFSFVAGDVGRCFRIWTQPAAYDAAHTYGIGDAVTYNGNFWTCNRASTTNVNPGATVTISSIPTIPWDLTPTLGRWTAGYISAYSSASVVDVHTTFAEKVSPLYRLDIDIWQIGLYTAGAYPFCGTWHEGRLALGSPATDRFDASISNGFNEFIAKTSGVGALLFSPSTLSGSVLDSSALAEPYNSKGQGAILWMNTDRSGLIFGTSRGEWLVAPSSSGAALAPSDIGIREVSRFKAAFVEPVRIGSALIFPQSAGRKMYEYIVDAFSNRFAGRPLNELAEHLPDTQGGIHELAFQEDPVPVVWAICNDAFQTTPGTSTLLGCTYRRISDFATVPPEFNGWHRHQHGAGRGFQSIAMATVGGQEALAALTYGKGGYSRVEIMSRLWKTAFFSTDADFVDGAPWALGGVRGNSAPGSILPGARRAVHFDGISTSLYRTTALVGVTDGPTGTVSLWFKSSSATTGSNFINFSPVVTGGGFPDVGASQSDVEFDSGGGYGQYLQNTAGSGIFRYNIGGGLHFDGNWHHLIISWDTNHLSGAKIGQVAVDGVVGGTTITDELGDAFDVHWSTIASVIGLTGYTGSTPNGAFVFDLAEFYFNTETHLDLTSSANMAKFRNPITHKPVDLAADGSGPTGAAPAIYLSLAGTGAASQFATNRGTGGDYTIAGPLTVAATAPF